MTAVGAVNSESADVCLPFLLADGSFRGRLVRLTTAATNILAIHADPEPVSILLAEAMVAAIALASGLKYDGVFTLQIRGNGPVHTLVTDVTSDGDLRGCVKFDAEGLAAELTRPKPGGFLPHLLGSGSHLAFTVDQGPQTKRYQGIVELSGETIAEAIHHYFRQSEQLESAIKIAVSGPRTAEEGRTASAILIQRMPEQDSPARLSREEADDVWRTAVILLSSLKDTELLDQTVAPERILSRLFTAVGVKALPRRSVAARCRCSRERSERILAPFPLDEVKAFGENGKVHMICEFCRTDYVFDESELENFAQRHNPNRNGG